MKRTKVVPIRFSFDEWKRIEIDAESRKTKPSAHVRNLALRKHTPRKPPFLVDPQMLAMLSPLTNQCAAIRFELERARAMPESDSGLDILRALESIDAVARDAAALAGKS